MTRSLLLRGRRLMACALLVTVGLAGGAMVDAGADLGHSRDHDGNRVPTGKAPEIGAYEQGALTLASESERARHAQPTIGLAGPQYDVPAAVEAAGGKFYVDSNRGSDASPGSEALPWRSLSKVSGYPFSPSDVVHFARGSNFTGGFVISASGTAGQPITFTSYGSGDLPRFSNPDFGLLNGNAIQITGSWVVIDGLAFHDIATVPPGNRADVRKLGAIFIAPEADHNVVRNCDITRTPVGIKIYGQYNLITHNYIHDSDKPGGCPGSC